MQPSVAIIMATYNGQDYLAEQIMSIKFQLFDNWKLILSDDASSDATLAIAQDLLGASNKLEVIINEQKAGKSPASNFLSALCSINISDYDYIAFADQDDIWAPAKLSNALSRLRTSNAFGYSSNLIAFNDQIRAAWFLDKSSKSTRYDYLFQGASAGCTYVLDKSLALLVRNLLLRTPIDLGNISHDWLIYAIAKSHRMKWIHDDSAHIFYRQHKANAYSALPGLGGIRRKYSLIKNGWYRSHILSLQHFLDMNQEEREIMLRLNRDNFLDRVWLSSRALYFRRSMLGSILVAFLLIFGVL